MQLSHHLTVLAMHFRVLLDILHWTVVHWPIERVRSLWPLVVSLVTLDVMSD
ncbi:hypothetical protein BDW59DRAFT_150040, partial [Aspergillus cavernicola]